MSKAAIVVAVILGVIAVAALWGIGNYNSLVTARNQVDKAWAGVETKYQRRIDLVDNLVASVKGAQGQEKAVFIAIADARRAYGSATTPEGKAQAAAAMETNIALIPRLQEAYPELKSNVHVATLMAEVSNTENGIQGARDNYNTVANNYNTNIQRFPKVLFANAFGFDSRTLFKSDTGAEKAPKINF